jgi:hypothetical protein
MAQQAMSAKASAPAVQKIQVRERRGGIGGSNVGCGLSEKDAWNIGEKLSGKRVPTLGVYHFCYYSDALFIARNERSVQRCLWLNGKPPNGLRVSRAAPEIAIAL